MADLQEFQTTWQQKMDELWASLRETQRQNEERAKTHAELARQMEETDRQMKKTDRKLGELGNRFGELAEHLVAPNIKEKFNALGYHFDDIFQDCVYRNADRESVEVDILLENETYTIAVEVKAKPKDRDIEEHIQRLEFLRRRMDRLRDSRKLLGAIAGAIMPDSVRNYALKAGLYVIEQTGDTVKIDNPQGFVPREW
jgi:hypothetical protein